MTIEKELIEHLKYDKDVGIFTWIKKPSQKTLLGAVAGRTDGGGYIQITYKGKAYKAHRIAFLFETGSWPTGDVDHINGQSNDNRWENLRDCTTQENCRNSKISASNTSGVKGVSWHGLTGKWVAQVRAGGKQHHLGIFESIEEAEQVVRAFRGEHHGEFTRHE